MRKLYFVLFLVFVAFVMAFAGDTVKMLRIYKNGNFTSIPLANIDSINHSKYDVDSVLNTDYSTSVIDALDSLYKIPFNSVDSFLVTDVDIEQYHTLVKNLDDFVSSEEETDIESYQNNLISFLNSQERVSNTSINNAKNHITITLSNGMEFYVDFESTSFFDENPVNNNLARSNNSDENEKYWDVSSYDDEKIISNSRILYFKCLSSLLFSMFDVYGEIESFNNSSPIDLILEKEETYSGLKKDYSKYGMVIISSTHGRSDWRNGSFKIFDRNEPSGIIVYQTETGAVNNDVMDIPFYKYVTPHEFKKAIGNYTPIVYADYCWGYKLSQSLSNCTVIGYDTKSFYWENRNRVKIYVYNMLNGLSHDKIMEYLTPYEVADPDRAWDSFAEITCNTLTNKKERQRYFSISTGDITDEGLLKGSINGYKNLKSGIHYYAYIFGKNEEFDPANIPSKGREIHVEDDGSFTCSLALASSQNEGSEHQVVVGFAYAGKYYYGEIKSFELEIANENPCTDRNHPHWVNLGLPSGTKWCCCNEGASMPEAKGGHYNYGAITTAPSYNQLNELINNTEKIWTTLNGVRGVQFIGTNGNTIFLPAAGFYSEGEYFNYTNRCDYWSSTPHEKSRDRARKMVINMGVNSSVEASIGYYNRYSGASVRSVR